MDELQLLLRVIRRLPDTDGVAHSDGRRLITLNNIRPAECLLMGWPGRAPSLLDVESRRELAAQGARPMSRESIPSTIGIDIGKNTFHVVGLDQRGAIVCN
jgi:hypothetical protein